MLEKGHTVRGTVRDAMDSRKTEHLMLPAIYLKVHLSCGAFKKVRL